MEKHTRTDNYDGALQTPLRSGYSATSTAAEVAKDIDLRGKIAIVTGGYTGIGLETVKTLSKAGAEVWVPVRDKAKAEKNLAAVPRAILHEMDLMDPHS